MSLQDYFLPVAEALQDFALQRGRQPTLILVNPVDMPEGVNGDTKAVAGIPVEACRAIPKGAVRLVIEESPN